MREILDSLKKLNELDVRLRTITKDIERLPRELTERQLANKSLQGSIERARAEILKLKVEADAIDLEVKSGEETLKRYSNQMNAMRTSKEFDTIKRQMAAQRAWNSDNEDKALKLLEQADTKQKDVDKNTAALAEAQAALAVESERVGKEIAELRAQQETILAERALMTAGVPDKELAIYNRIVATHGNAIALVHRGNCSACFMKIPPQTHNLALLAREMVCCPSCGRILTASKEPA